MHGATDGAGIHLIREREREREYIYKEGYVYRDEM